ncbi:MAG: hypothetical protein JWN92_1995 [Candidatus Acidoferrum typicum]|nr:hypothetical protein [Candidatus Acidoferrum typicum]
MRRIIRVNLAIPTSQRVRAGCRHVTLTIRSSRRNHCSRDLSRDGLADARVGLALSCLIEKSFLSSQQISGPLWRRLVRRDCFAARFASMPAMRSGFGESVRGAKRSLLELLIVLKRDTKTVVGYGAQRHDNVVPLQLEAMDSANGFPIFLGNIFLGAPSDSEGVANPSGAPRARSYSNHPAFVQSELSAAPLNLIHAKAGEPNEE